MTTLAYVKVPLEYFDPIIDPDLMDFEDEAIPGRRIPWMEPSYKDEESQTFLGDEDEWVKFLNFLDFL